MQAHVSLETTDRARYRMLRFVARDRISAPFEYQLDVETRSRSLDLDRVLGRSATVSVSLPRNRQRHFNGVIDAVEQLRDTQRGGTYRFFLRPAVGHLRHAHDSRIFRGKTTAEVLEEVLGSHDLNHIIDLRHETDPPDMIVQFDESDLNFVHRLIADAGATYYFTHSGDAHTMVVTDAVAGLGTFTGFTSIRFTGGAAEGISDWRPRAKRSAVRVSLDDHDFIHPEADLAVTASSGSTATSPEAYHYPGGYVMTSDGTVRAEHRLEGLRATNWRRDGEGDSRGLVVGHVFGMTDHPRDDQNDKYLPIGTVYTIDAIPDSSRAEISCRVTAVPASGDVRHPPFANPINLRGPHTAVVTGPAGTDIFTDEFGRVKVLFHWDRQGAADETASAWVRVAQLLAGHAASTLAIPRVGDEVVIEFEHGDPARPIVTGSVWNGDNVPPVQLPDEKRKTGLITDSGRAQQRLVFDDSDGEETITIQTDGTLTLESGREMVESVRGDRIATIQGNAAFTTIGRRDSSVRSDDSLIVSGTVNETIGGAVSTDIGTNRTVTIRGEDHASVGKSRTRLVEGDNTLTVDRDATSKARQKYSASAGQAMDLFGEKSVRVHSGGSVSIGNDRGFIAITPAGEVIIKGMKVTIQADTQVHVNSPDIVEVEGPLQALAGLVSVILP